MTDRLPVLGIDIGGSKIAVGLVDTDGRLLDRAQAATPAADGRAEILATATRLADEVTAGRPIAGIGIGSGGVISGGVVVAGTSMLAGWVGTDLVRYFTESTGAGRVAVVNDVHAHGVGEAWVGAGAGMDCVLVVAVGTGLGGVVVDHGRPLVGAHGVAGHLGHITSAAATGLPCGCGADGHLEAISSGYGLVQLYRSLGGDPVLLTAQDIAGRADRDRSADEAVRRSAAALGAALGDLINIIDPDVVIISGGLTGAGPVWWQQVRAAASSAALPVVSGTPILPSALG
ncbi:MAG: ROK family protein, partial [Microlunatus sp.]|nr:ROK family protein [Microlunatus sp.]